MSKKPVATIVIDNELDDDWMKQLPGYRSEVEIHEELARKYAEKKARRTLRIKRSPAR